MKRALNHSRNLSFLRSLYFLLAFALLLCCSPSLLLTENPRSQADASSDEIQLSFKGAKIDMVIQWLAEATGKSIVKHPKVKCELTIVSSKKLTHREAVNLVYRALALEGCRIRVTDHIRDKTSVKDSPRQDTSNEGWKCGPTRSGDIQRRYGDSLSRFATGKRVSCRSANSGCFRRLPATLNLTDRTLAKRLLNQSFRLAAWRHKIPYPSESPPRTIENSKNSRHGAVKNDG